MIKKILPIALALFVFACGQKKRHPSQENEYPVLPNLDTVPPQHAYDRPFTTADTLYDFPLEFNYTKITGHKGLHERIYPIGFSANWIYFAYLTSNETSKGKAPLLTMVVKDLRQDGKSYSLSEYDSTITGVEKLWTKGRNKFVKLLSQFSIIQEKVPDFAFGTSLETADGTIQVTASSILLKSTSGSYTTEGEAYFEIYAKHERGGDKIMLQQFQTVMLKIREMELVGAFKGKKHLVFLSAFKYENVLKLEGKEDMVHVMLNSIPTVHREFVAGENNTPTPVGNE